MDKITGNFLTQANKDFPLDCETLEVLQTNAALVATLGNLIGDKLILSGCEFTNNNTQRNAGYVFLRTKDYPEGEVLRWTGGDISGGMYVKLEDIAVTAQGYDYPKAYTRRTLAPGVGGENFSWADFRKPKSPDYLERMISNLAESLAEVIEKTNSEPLGIVKMWAGVEIPENYALCNGAELRVADYPELYSAIGTTFNKSVDPNGRVYDTQTGFFRLPDLRGRFVVGYHDADTEYNGYGKTGGEKVHTLTVDELANHSHGQNLWAEAAGTWRGGGNNSSPDSTSNHSKTTPFGETDGTGLGRPHENRPPFYALAYIIKVR